MACPGEALPAARLLQTTPPTIGHVYLTLVIFLTLPQQPGADNMKRRNPLCFSPGICLHDTKITLCIALIAFLFASLARANDINRVDSVTTDVIKPLASQFETASDKLLEAAQQSCPSDTLQQAYAEAVIAFSQLEILQIGQLLEANRLKRLFYWPDRKMAGLRQLDKFRTSLDNTSLTLIDLQSKSVALQGFPALGRIIHSAQQPDETDCHLMSVISANINSIAQTLHKDWHAASGIYSQLNNPTKEARFRSHKESTAAVLKLVDTGLRNLRDRKLKVIIENVQRKGDLPRTAPFYYSGLTFIHLRHNLKSIASIMQDTKLTGITDKQDRMLELFQRANLMLDEAESALANSDKSVAFLRLVALTSFIDRLQDILREDIMKAYNIPIGFNSADGD